MISKIVSNEDVTNPAFDDASLPVVYWVPPVTFTKEFALVTKLAIEPVPFSIISNTILNEDVVLLIKDELIVVPVVDMNGVTFVVPIALVTMVGIEPVPLSTISKMISNELLNKFLSDWSTLIEEVIWVPLILPIPLFVEDTIVGITPTPLSIILITFPKDEDTIVLSEDITSLLAIYCSSVVALIPAKVFETNVGYATLPLLIIFVTISNPSSIAFPPIAINLVNSFAKLIASIVSVDCASVACDGYL